MLEIFIKTFVLYFIVIDPLGNTPLFLIITQHLETKDKIKTALGGIMIATIILLFFALLGNFILSYLNITENLKLRGKHIFFNFNCFATNAFL